MTRDQMIECGRNIDATHAIIYKDTVEQAHPYVAYVLPENNVDEVQAECWKTSYDVEVIKL